MAYPERLANALGGSAEAARGCEPAGRLAGDLRDAVVVLVVVQDCDAGGFRGGGDQQVLVLD